MQVTNIHIRNIHQKKEKVSELFKTLATSNDLIWPHENWPTIKFPDGLKAGSRGGHGIIRYAIIEFREEDYIKFQFSKPEGLIGTHEFIIKAINEYETEIRHEIKARTTLKTAFLWTFVIRWLHDALIEEAFDKVENFFTRDKIKPKYNPWVKLIRKAYRTTSFQTKTV